MEKLKGVIDQLPRKSNLMSNILKTFDEIHSTKVYIDQIRSYGFIEALKQIVFYTSPFWRSSNPLILRKLYESGERLSINATYFSSEEVSFRKEKVIQQQYK